MVTIEQALGENWNIIRLKDNECLFGGKSHSKETLGEFMKDCDILPSDDYGELCIAMEEQGLKAIRPIAHINQIERKEQGLDIIDFTKNW